MGTWKVKPEWKGETAFIIGGGTSVGRQNVHRLQGRKVIAVNSSYQAAPFAQILFFNDNRWWQQHAPTLEAEWNGKLVTVSQAAKGARLIKLDRATPEEGLSLNPGAVCSLRTSLQGAMNLAFHLGVTRIVLLGADMCRAEDGRTHHHKPHLWRNKPGNETWDTQMQQLVHIVEPLKKHGVEVLNASPISRIPWWPKIDYAAFVG